MFEIRFDSGPAHRGKACWSAETRARRTRRQGRLIPRSVPARTNCPRAQSDETGEKEKPPLHARGGLTQTSIIKPMSCKDNLALPKTPLEALAREWSSEPKWGRRIHGGLPWCPRLPSSVQVRRPLGLPKWVRSSLRFSAFPAQTHFLIIVYVNPNLALFVALSHPSRFWETPRGEGAANHNEQDRPA